MPLYTHKESQTKGDQKKKKKGWLSQPTYIQIANHKKYTICVWFLQLSTTIQHNSPRGNLSSKRKLEDDIRTKYLNKIGLTINPQKIQNWTWTLGLDCNNNHTLVNNQNFYKISITHIIVSKGSSNSSSNFLFIFIYLLKIGLTPTIYYKLKN